MTLKKWLIASCLALITSFAQALTLEEQAQLKAANVYDMIIYGYYDRGEFKQALRWAEKAFKVRRKILGDKDVATFQSLNLLALSYHKLGRLKEALSFADKGYNLLPEVEDALDINKVLNLTILVGIYRDLGQLDNALPLAEENYALAKKMANGELLFTFGAMNNLAAIYYELGRIEDALPLLEKGTSLIMEMSDDNFPKMPSLPSFNRWLEQIVRSNSLNKAVEKGYKMARLKMVAQALNNLAVIYLQLGKLDEALPLFEKAYRYRLKLFGEKHPETLESMNNLAAIYKDLGKLPEALSLLEKGYQFAREGLGKKHLYTIIGLNQLAFLYQEIGRLDEALPLYEKSYRLAKEVLGEKHHQTLHILNNWAFIHRKLGYLDEALSLFKKMYRLAHDAFGDKHALTITSLNNLAETHRELKHLDKALSLFDKAYQLAKEAFGEKQLKTITSLNNVGSIHRELGSLDEALPLIEKSYHLFREVLGEKKPLTLTTLNNLAGLYVEQGHIQKGIAHFEQLVAGIESLRRSDLSAENRQAWFQQWVVGYFVFASLYIKESRPLDAFRLAEMSKARTLLESLATKLAAQQSGLTATEQQQLRDSEARLAFLNNNIAKALENKRLEEKIYLETEKNQRVSRFNEFHRQLMAKYPKYAQLSEVQIVGAQEGAKYLPADAVFISYLVAKDKVNKNQVLAFILQPDGTLTTHNLGKIPHLKKDLESYQRQLSLLGRGRPIKRSPKFHKDIETLSRELGKQLLGPLSALIKDKSHWIISPDGLLALLPFETLRIEGEKQPVIAQHQISYVQSLSVLKLLQERDKVYQSLKNRGTLLAMGAPLYGNLGTSKTKGNLSTTDFNIARSLVMRGSDYGRALRQLDMKWRNLPGALRELEQLEALFKETDPRIYKQADATEAQLQSLNQQGELAKYRYLVFSAHGYLSSEVPALSSIVLGQVNNPQGIDGYITAGEWPSYDLKSDLMVLSACETGVGEVVGGEGVMGLPYAFYVAGNKNAILTLWSISDNVTTEFVTRFFAKLKAGMGQLEALAATKREFIKKGGRYSNPAYWAAFVLYGV